MRCLRSFSCLVAALFVAGCATSSTLPKGAKVVGGGLLIHYAPSTEGVCFLVEKKSGKIIATQSSREGAFEFDATGERERAILEATLGQPGPDAQFVLYFLPE